MKRTPDTHRGAARLSPALTACAAQTPEPTAPLAHHGQRHGSAQRIRRADAGNHAHREHGRCTAAGRGGRWIRPAERRSELKDELEQLSEATDAKVVIAGNQAAIALTFDAQYKQA